MVYPTIEKETRIRLQNMQGHHRKIELQSAADFSYLYANTVAFSRQKLDLHFPPSVTGDSQRPDPMKDRVKELVDEVAVPPPSQFSTKSSTTWKESGSSDIVYNTNLHLRSLIY